MRVAIDTSVVVPALVVAHPRHERALAWVMAARRGRVEAVMTWHAIAETWSVLTRLPLDPPVPARVARDALARLERSIRPLSLDAATYRAALRRCEERGLRSGAVFDALHVVAAERARADVLLTFDVDDFARLATPGGPAVRAPDDLAPPGRLRHTEG